MRDVRTLHWRRERDRERPMLLMCVKHTIITRPGPPAAIASTNDSFAINKYLFLLVLLTFDTENNHLASTSSRSKNSDIEHITFAREKNNCIKIVFKPDSSNVYYLNLFVDSAIYPLELPLRGFFCDKPLGTARDTRWWVWQNKYAKRRIY